jgi:hypothetical protein
VKIFIPSNKLLVIFKKENKLPQILVLLSFVITYAIVRTITHLQKAHLLPNQNGPLHIHHMVPGILLLLITGYVSISYWSNEKIRHICAIFFGIGAALTIDEFALWLFLQNVYWAKQGRDSVDAVIITIVLLTLAVIFGQVHTKDKLK